MNVVQLKPPVQESVVETLRTMLAQAESGELTALVGMSVTNGSYVAYSTASIIDSVTMSSLVHHFFNSLALRP